MDEEEIVFGQQGPRELQKTNEAMRLPDFKSIERCLYALPVLSSIDSEIEKTLPCYETRGYIWAFVLQDQERPDALQWITYEMIKTWGITTQRLMQAAKKNLTGHLSDIAYMALFGKIDKNVALPFCKIYFKGENDEPPFGSSLILSDVIMRRIYSLMGDFIAFLPDVDTVYVLPSEILKKKKIHPEEAIRAIMEKTPEGAPAFFQAGLLFPEKATNDQPDTISP